MTEPATLDVDAAVTGDDAFEDASGAAFAGSKRHRRPSVRLGDLGAPPAVALHKSNARRTKEWNHNTGAGDRPRLLLPPPRRDGGKQPSKSRPVAAIAEGDDLLYSAAEVGAVVPVDGNAVGIRRARDAKARRSGGVGVRRIRSSWMSPKIDESPAVAADAVVKLRDGEDAGENGYQDVGGGDEMWVEDSQSPSERRHGARVRVRVSENHDLGIVADTEEHDVMEDDCRDQNGFDQNGCCGSLDEGGVRSWLDRLGLGRYSSVFDVHEVDDEVLPLLTLEDLKDMGISAVGSRRKLFCAIQNLRKRHC